MSFSQSERQARLTSALGKTDLVLVSFSGTDTLSGGFDYSVEALASDAEIDPEKLIGTHATIEIETEGEAPACFDGIVTEFFWQRPDTSGHVYRMRLRPWLWVAGLRRNQRIFHDLTVVELLEELFAPYAAYSTPHLQVRLKADYPKLEYTVQFQESDMAFACRMMERFGITWYFKHVAGGHTLVMTDESEEHEALPGGARPLRQRAATGDAGRDEHFWDWRAGARITTGAIRLVDYNFKTPAAAMELDQADHAAHEHGDIESFDWPGLYIDPDEGRDMVARRLIGERGQAQRHRA